MDHLIPERQTTWHVTEPAQQRIYHVTNTAPRMLRWILAPWAASHRVAAALRRRAGSGPSFLRLTLEPIGGAGPEIIVAVVLMRSRRPIGFGFMAQGATCCS